MRLSSVDQLRGISGLDPADRDVLQAAIDDRNGVAKTPRGVAVRILWRAKKLWQVPSGKGLSMPMWGRRGVAVLLAERRR